MYSFLNLLHFVLIVQPLFFALQLLTSKREVPVPNRVLGISMIVISFYYLINADFFASELPFLLYKRFYVFGVLFLINPFYYLYTKSLTTEGYKFDIKVLLHFIPSLIFLILSLLIFLPQSPLLFSVEVFLHIVAVVYTIQVIIYSLLMFFLLKEHNVNLKNYFSFSENINLNWLKFFIIIYVLITILDLFIFYSHNQSLRIYYYLLMIFFFNFIGYFGGQQLIIYPNIINNDSVNDSVNDSESKDINQKNNRININETKKQLMIDIVALMDTNKMYLNNKLSIFDLSEELRVNKTYISNVINDNFNENFNSFINRYRILEAKELIMDSNFDHLTFEAIANKVGFNSKASFNSAFKKYTMMTPSAYKKQRLDFNT